MAVIKIRKLRHLFYKNKVLFFSVLAVSFLSTYIIFSEPEAEKTILSGIIDKTSLIEKNTNQTVVSPLDLWEAPNQDNGGFNSFATISYNKCIPVQQCKFDDCNIDGSYDGNGNFCLPVAYSQIGDWAPDISINAFGVSLLKNPVIYNAPVEHTQASARLPDKNNNAYFMFTNSQNYYAFIWVVEVKGIDSINPQHVNPSMPANVVWWQKLNKCDSLPQCDDQYNPGNFNHPARISLIDSMVAVAFQNYSYTLQGKFSLATVSSVFDQAIPIPEFLQTSTLPKYPQIRSADAVGFYDVSNPSEPKFIRKLIGDIPELWGGNPPGRDISEVAIAKAGDYYHLHVGGTIYNYNGEGGNKIFGKHYRMISPYSTSSITPLLGNMQANVFTNVGFSDGSFPTMISLNSVPIFVNEKDHFKYALTVQLIETQITYDTNPKHVINESTNNIFLENQNVLSTDFIAGKVKSDMSDYGAIKKQILADLMWMSEACKRAWGFQMLANGGYNVICHDMDPARQGLNSKGRFLVRGVSPEYQLGHNASEKMTKYPG